MNKIIPARSTLIGSALRLIIPSVIGLSVWLGAMPRGARAGELNLPARFSVEVFPAINSAAQQQEAVVYHFDRGQVRAAWQRTDLIKDQAKVLRWVSTTRMKGAFRDGVLSGEQFTESALIRVAGDYGDDFTGGPVMKMLYRGVIEGQVQADGRIKAQVTTTLTSQKVLTFGPGSGAGRHSFQWVDQQLPQQLPPAVLEYWVSLPSDHWFTSRHILASGPETFRLRNVLERLDRYLTEAEANLLAGNYDLGQRQLDTIRAEIAELQGNLRSGNQTVRLHFRGLPTDDAMLRQLRLQLMMNKWKEAYTIVNEALGRVQTELADLRHVLSGNVFKSIIKNYISWSGSIPTDLQSGIAGYSPITSIADLPRGFLEWYEASQKDAGILNEQFRKKRALTELERFYEAKREYIIGERRKVAEMVKATERSPLIGLDRSLEQFFAGLGWATWQADPQRAEASARLQGGSGE